MDAVMVHDGAQVQLEGASLDVMASFTINYPKEVHAWQLPAGCRHARYIPGGIVRASCRDGIRK